MAVKIEKKGETRRLENRLGITGWIYAGRYWIERYAYLLHRITGLALILYLVLHVYVVGERAKGQEAWESIMALMDNPVMKVLEFLLLAAFLYHAVNGFRLILTELGFFLGKPQRPVFPYKSSIGAQRPLMYFLMIVGAFFLAVSFIEFFHLF